MFSKTIIHQSHINIANEVYKVSVNEYREAKEIVQSEKKIFAQNDKMVEKLTMVSYSQSVLRRAEIYGTYEEKEEQFEQL